MTTTLVNSTKILSVDTESRPIENIISDIVSGETGKIDEYVDNIKKALDEDDLSINELNRILIKLCSFSYYLAERQEMVGVRGDIAEAIHSEKYNNALLDAQGTVARKQSIAEEQSKEEQVISTIYNKAYKILKGKRDSIDKFSDAIKKIVTSKVKEMELIR